jgi:hypothetical protein
MSALCLQPLAHQQTTALPQAMTTFKTNVFTFNLITDVTKDGIGN